MPFDKFDLFAGNGKVCALLRAYDWSASPLGYPPKWDNSLRTVVSLMLDSKFPMFVAWGKDLSLLYNDAYVDILGEKHPWALGQRFGDIWPEIWQEISPLIDRALAGEATYYKNLQLTMMRKGHEEKAWFTFSYSPVRDESGAVAGMFCAVTETTDQVNAQRRQAFQLEMADRLRGIAQPEEIIGAAAKLLGQFLGVARVGYAQIDQREKAISMLCDWTDGSVASLVGRTIWLERFGAPVIDALRSGKSLRVEDIAADNRSAPHAKIYAAIGARSIVVVPLIKQERLTALLSITASAPRRWDDEEVALAEDVAERTWAALERAHADASRRRAEEALNKQLAAESEKLRILFEQAPSFMAVTRGPEHVFELANAAYMKLTGPREVLGKTVREAFPEVAGQGFFELLDEVYATGKPFFAHEAPLLMQQSPDAAPVERFLDFIYQPIIEQNGSISGIFIEGYDVTERKLAARALQESEARLRQLANTIPHLAWMANPDGWIHWYNDRWYEYTGTTPEQMQGWGWEDVHDPTVLPAVLKMWGRSIESAEPFEMTFPLRGADGEYRPFFTRVAPLRDSSGRIVQWFGTNTDVSPLEKAQKALRESQERLNEGLSAGRMVVWDWDLATGKIQASANSKEVFGTVWTDYKNRRESVHPEDRHLIEQAVNEALAGRGQYHQVVRVIRPDNGKIVWSEVRGKVKRDACGKPVSISGISLDITERKRAEEELLQADRRKDEFLAMLAHELRNPLAPISTAAQLLKFAQLDERRIRETSEIISRQAQHMSSLIDDLLDVSRVTRGLIVLERECVDMKVIASEAVEQVRPLVRARHHRIAVHMPPEPIWVQGDRTRLVQIIANLLNNAAKYTPDGGEIELRLEAEGSRVECRVRDNGIGISADLLPHVFELFAQGQRSPDRSQGGLGLGLALVNSLVELHGGSIAAYSEGAGCGSEFTVSLPRLLAHPEARADSVKEKPPYMQPANKALRIMIVDDNADAANSLALLLQAQGHQVAVEYSAQDALERARLEAPEVLLLDIGLPDMDGNALARQMRTLPQTASATLIALTGYGQEKDRIRSKEAGFDHHLVKPADSTVLKDLLARIG